MNDFNELLKAVVGEARAIGIPVSRVIDPEVVVNKRAKKRLGCCIYRGFVNKIELSAGLLEADEKLCRQTLAHEILHTCFGCRNHGERWKAYAKRMNEAYGYDITRVVKENPLGETAPRPVRHLLICEKCGAEITRTRETKLTRYPGRYRCRCGGKLKLVY